MMNDAFEGRGGGKPVMVQGTLRGKKRRDERILGNNLRIIRKD